MAVSMASLMIPRKEIHMN